VKNHHFCGSVELALGWDHKHVGGVAAWHGGHGPLLFPGGISPTSEKIIGLCPRHVGFTWIYPPNNDYNGYFNKEYEDKHG
jgi:hypothetical protein